MIEYRLEAYLDSVWEDLSDDLVGPIAWNWGQRGGTCLDRVAQGGALTFQLNNSIENSAGVVGYYSPRNPAKRTGWKTGVPVRLTLIEGTDEYVKHRGWLDRIKARPGDHGAHSVECVSKSWFDQLSRHQVRGIATLVDVTADEVAQALIDEMPVAPFAVDLDVGTDELPWALDDLRGGTYLAAFSRVVFTEFGYGYELADGTVRLEARTRRVNAAMPQFTISAMRALDTDEAQSSTGNLVRVTILPREPDDSIEILASLKRPVEIGPGETVTIELKYVDPTQRASRVGGTDMVTPVATTDYLFNSAADGSGTNMTADLTVDAVFGGDSVILHLTNDNISTIGFVTKMEPRGRGLFTYDPVTFEARDQAAIDETGERTVDVDMPYQNEPNVARSVADAVLVAWLNPGQALVITFLAEWNSVHLEALLSADIGTPIAAIESEVTGLNEAWWINGIDVRHQEEGVTWVTWYLTKADAGLYWELGIVGRSELGETTVIGPF